MYDFLGGERNRQSELGAGDNPSRVIALPALLKTRFGQNCVERPSSRTLFQKQAHRLTQSYPGFRHRIATTRHVEFGRVAHEGWSLLPDVGGKVNFGKGCS